MHCGSVGLATQNATAVSWTPTVKPFQPSLLRLRQLTVSKVPVKRRVPWGSPVPSSWYSVLPFTVTMFLYEVPQPQ